MIGLGKTLTTLFALNKLEAFPALVVCPKFALGVWEEEAKLVNLPVWIYSGTPTKRKEIWAKFCAARTPKILVTNYAFQLEIAILSNVPVSPLLKKSARTALAYTPPGSRAKFYWQSIVWDEAHMGLMNHKNKSYKAAHYLAKSIPVRYVLTGTPYRQGCVDLYCLLNLMDNITFDSYWKFVNKYCVVIENPWGKEIARNPNNIRGFRTMINKYMVRRLKSEVLTELPALNRQIIPIEMNSKQRKVYKELEEENMAFIEDSDNLLITPNQMTVLLRLRQLMCCPRLLGIDDDGASLDAIVEHSHTSLDVDKPIVIFTPFRKAIPFIEKALTKEYKEIRFFEICGGLTATQFHNSWLSFQKATVGKRVLICVIKSGASFQATAASTGYFLGYEWDFNLDLQSEARLHRMGQKDAVNIYYMGIKNTVDFYVLQKMQEKFISAGLVVGTPSQLVKIMKKYYHRNNL